MTAPLPSSWDDEPWPLDDPVPSRGLNPVNWSDTHADPPQVADLADEAWEYAVDHGVSMEVALARLQDRAQRTADVQSWVDEVHTWFQPDEVRERASRILGQYSVTAKREDNQWSFYGNGSGA